MDKIASFLAILLLSAISLAVNASTDAKSLSNNGELKKNPQLEKKDKYSFTLFNFFTTNRGVPSDSTQTNRVPGSREEKKTGVNSSL